MIHYYSLRRVNPYLGVIQVIDTGAVRAYSSHGERWQPRRVYDSQQFWTAAEASHNCGFEVLPKEVLLRAIAQRPAMPFPQQDQYELWLLYRSSQQPLALLKTCRWERDVESKVDPNWRPFLPGSAHFPGAAHQAGGLKDAKACQDEVERLVNFSAKPAPCAQWFHRQPDGSGIGMGGLRVDHLLGRRLPATAFPELLVDEQCWPDAQEQQRVCAFHDFFAASLLVHQGIAEPLRRRLESAVQRSPSGLVDTYHLLPEKMDPEGLAVAMVASKLMQGSTGARR